MPEDRDSEPHSPDHFQNAGNHPTGARRPYDRHDDHDYVEPLHHGYDRRYSRPHHDHMHHHSPYVHYGPPDYYWYRPYYSRWWCHPYWRYTYPTWMVVDFWFPVYPWYDYWYPPYRSGWSWVPGYWAFGYWHPGYWRPIYRAPRHYVYVPGYWYRDVYVEGYYRTETRRGWVWVDGYYLDDGTHVPGYWRPRGEGPEGYVWEPGFFDGETWIDGFWRPEYRSGYRWVSAYYDADSVYHGGYWMPLREQPGKVWIPGWFDGEQWVQGYWVDEVKYVETDPEAWVPPEGADDGWDEEEARGRVVYDDTTLDSMSDEERPIALPVDSVETQAVDDVPVDRAGGFEKNTFDEP